MTIDMTMPDTLAGVPGMTELAAELAAEAAAAAAVAFRDRVASNAREILRERGGDYRPGIRAIVTGVGASLESAASGSATSDDDDDDEDDDTDECRETSSCCGWCEEHGRHHDDGDSDLDDDLESESTYTIQVDGTWRRICTECEHACD